MLSLCSSPHATVRLLASSTAQTDDKMQSLVWPWIRIRDHNPQKVVVRGASTLMPKRYGLRSGILPPLKAQMQHASEDVKIAAENVCGKAM